MNPFAGAAIIVDEILDRFFFSFHIRGIRFRIGLISHYIVRRTLFRRIVLFSIRRSRRHGILFGGICGFRPGRNLVVWSRCGGRRSLTALLHMGCGRPGIISVFAGCSAWRRRRSVGFRFFGIVQSRHGLVIIQTGWIDNKRAALAGRYGGFSSSFSASWDKKHKEQYDQSHKNDGDSNQ